MAVSFRVNVVNGPFAVRRLDQTDRALRARLTVATDKARLLLHDALVAAAPDPHSNAEVQGHGVRVEKPSVPERFAGRLVGGVTAVDRIYTIEASLASRSVAAYVEGGTGVYRDPEFGGPGEPYTVRAKGKSLHPFTGNAFGGAGSPGQDPLFGLDVFRKEVTIPGTRPHPWVERVYVETRDEIEQLYENAVHRSI